MISALVTILSLSTLASSTPEALLGYYTGASLYADPGYCANGGVCVPPMYCSIHYADLVYNPTSTGCWLAINTPGICCYPTIPNVQKVKLLNFRRFMK